MLYSLLMTKFLKCTIITLILEILAFKIIQLIYEAHISGMILVETEIKTESTHFHIEFTVY